MNNSARSSMTVCIHHKTTKPPDLGSPLNRKMPEAAHQVVPDKALLASAYEILETGGKEVIEEIVESPCPEIGYIELKAYFKEEVSSELISSFVGEFWQTMRSVNLHSIKVRTVFHDEASYDESRP